MKQRREVNRNEKWKIRLVYRNGRMPEHVEWVRYEENEEVRENEQEVSNRKLEGKEERIKEISEKGKR